MARSKLYEKTINIPMDRPLLDWLETERNRSGIPTAFYIRELIKRAQSEGLSMALTASVKEDS